MAKKKTVTKAKTTARVARAATQSPASRPSKPRAKQKKKELRSVSLNHDRIATRAYEIWETSGFPPGCEFEHWVQAEQDLSRVQAP